LPIPVKADFEFAKGIAKIWNKAKFGRKLMREQRDNPAGKLQTDVISVADATARAVQHIRQACKAKGIEIETDLSGVTVEAPSTLIIPAVAGLLTNAIAAMPAGGELSVTLVETEFQWELEVADSGVAPSQFPTSLGLHKTETVQSLPTILEFEAHAALHSVIQLAEKHCGDVHTFACPLGGSAHVLTVPKIITSDNQTQSRRAG
jgi:light-regulated signal transduction histidine kinase (bacteriophytochrome)